MLDPKVFKAYDVRGLYPTELDEDGAYAIGRALRRAVRAAADRGRPRHAALVAVDGAGGDRGRADGGADVLDIGLVGTEMVYFAVGELGLDGGVMVTASHNPKEYTGMKIVRARRAAGRRRVRAARGARPRWCAPTAPRGRAARCASEDIWPAFVERVLSFVDVSRDPAAAAS